MKVFHAIKDKRTAKALRVGVIWLLLEIIIHCWLLYDSWHGAIVFLCYIRAFVLVGMILFCFLSCIKSLFQRALPAAILYLCFVFFVIPKVEQVIFPLEMNMMAYWFYYYPETCPLGHSSDQTSYICYRYLENIEEGRNVQIVFNPGGEMSRPLSQWPQEIKNIFGYQYRIEPLSDDNCLLRNTKQVIGSVFLVVYDCYPGKESHLDIKPFAPSK